MYCNGDNDGNWDMRINPSSTKSLNPRSDIDLVVAVSVSIAVAVGAVAVADLCRYRHRHAGPFV